MLNIFGKEVKIQLTQEIGATASFSQFEYKILGEKASSRLKSEEINEDLIPVLEKRDDEDDFNSLWTSI